MLQERRWRRIESSQVLRLYSVQWKTWVQATKQQNNIYMCTRSRKPTQARSSVVVTRIGDRPLRWLKCCFTSTQTVGLSGTGSPGRPPRRSHSSWALSCYLLGFAHKGRAPLNIFPSQILCRLYKSPSDENMNIPTGCKLYNARNATQLSRQGRSSRLENIHFANAV